MGILKNLFDAIARSSGKSHRFRGYHIIKIIHDGEKSAVYQARSAEDDKLYAIKVYKPHYNQVANRMCRRYHIRPEGELGMSLNPRANSPVEHPIVKTISSGYEFDNSSKCYYLIQEFISGLNLKHLVGRTEELTLAHRLKIAATLARGLAIIHERGLIHRDICTDNIIVTRDGDTKLIDLGFMAPTGIAFREQTGTPSYMSPEQFQAQKLHPTADIYSFGIVLFELFTGRLPFTSKFSMDKADVRIRRTSELMDKHLRDAPPRPSDIAKDIPPKIERIILHSLEKDPAKRYENMREIISVLSVVQEQEGAGT